MVLGHRRQSYSIDEAEQQKILAACAMCMCGKALVSESHCGETLTLHVSMAAAAAHNRSLCARRHALLNPEYEICGGICIKVCSRAVCRVESVRQSTQHLLPLPTHYSPFARAESREQLVLDWCTRQTFNIHAIAQPWPSISKRLLVNFKLGPIII